MAVPLKAVSSKQELQSSTSKKVFSVMDPTRTYFRFVVLFFTCVMSFGNYYCFDMPSVLQSQFQAPLSCPQNYSNCSTGLGMSSRQYNLLYAVYSWTNAIVVIFSGFFIDKFGNMAGALNFSLLCFLGSSVFALGSSLKDPSTMMTTMLAGRLLFGAGDGSVTIVQYRLCSMWFKNKELAFAFSMKLVASRLGSTLNFFLTDKIATEVGIWKTLAFGAGLCGLGLLSALIVGTLDSKASEICSRNQLLLSQHVNEANTGESIVKFSHITKLPKIYWMICASIVFFYCTLFPFVADSAKFVSDKYQYDNDKASLIAGSLYDVSLFVMPLIGGIVDFYGFRGFLCASAQVLTVPVFLFFALDYSSKPLPLFIYYGVTYSLTASVLWACIPLVVSPNFVGTAMGVASCVQMLGIGTSNMVVGWLLDDVTDDVSDKPLHPRYLDQWRNVMLYFLGTTTICALCCLMTCLYDLCFGEQKLNRGKRSLMRLMRTNVVVNINSNDRDEHEGCDSPLGEPDETFGYSALGKKDSTSSYCSNGSGRSTSSSEVSPLYEERRNSRSSLYSPGVNA